MCLEREADPPLTCEDGTGRSVDRIRERHGTFRVEVLEAGPLVHAWLLLASLEIAPFLELLVLDVILVGNLLVGNEHVAEGDHRSVVGRLRRHRADLAALHRSGVFEGRLLETATKALGILIRV